MLDVMPNAVQQERHAGDEDHKRRPAGRSATLSCVLVVVGLLVHGARAIIHCPDDNTAAASDRNIFLTCPDGW